MYTCVRHIQESKLFRRNFTDFFKDEKKKKEKKKRRTIIFQGSSFWASVFRCQLYTLYISTCVNVAYHFCLQSVLLAQQRPLVSEPAIVSCQLNQSL